MGGVQGGLRGVGGESGGDGKAGGGTSGGDAGGTDGGSGPAEMSVIPRGQSHPTSWQQRVPLPASYGHAFAFTWRMVAHEPSSGRAASSVMVPARSTED